MNPQVGGSHSSSAQLNITRRRSKIPCLGELFLTSVGKRGGVEGERETSELLRKTESLENMFLAVM